jgi:LacI family transcriptional regulator
MRSHVSCRDVAQRAGVSANTVSLALRNSPRISPETRSRVRLIADQLGYSGDPRLTEYMRYIRARRESKHRPVLALINAHPAPLSALKSPNIKGIAAAATIEAARQGFRLEEFSPGARRLSCERLSDILEARGITGLVVLPLPAGCTRLPLRWDLFAAVSTCYSAYALGLNLVTTNRQHYLELALQHLRALGYRRIGLAIDHDTDARSHHQTLAHFLWYQSNQPSDQRVNPLSLPELDRAAVREWISAERPEAIISTRNHVHGFLLDLRMRVPADIGFASLAASARDVPFLAGVDERPDAVGVSAIDMLVAQLQRGEFGLPATRRLTLVEGSWIKGKTVRALRRTQRTS